MLKQGVYCNAHRSRDGCWVDASQVERTVEGRLKIYVARHGHGTYPKVSSRDPQSASSELFPLLTDFVSKECLPREF